MHPQRTRSVRKTSSRSGLRLDTVRLAIACGCLAVVGTSARLARGNGVELPVDVDRPVPVAPDKRLPYPVVEERAPVAPAFVGVRDLPKDPALLVLPSLANGARQDDALGTSFKQYEGIIVRQSKTASGKVELPAGSFGYVAEAAMGAPPAGDAALAIGGAPRWLVDVDQSIVTRKDVSLSAGESVVLGSTVLTYADSWPLTSTLSAGITTASLAGFEWGRVGIGSFELSMTQPAWAEKTFRKAFEQGRLEEVTPKLVRFAWVSSTRTDALTVAEKQERAASVKAGDEIALSGGGKIRVVGVDGGAKRVRLDTPEGPKVLSVDDPKRLMEDQEIRKKLVAIGKDFAVVLVPTRSEFAKNEAYVAIYSKLHVYKNGEAFDEDPRFRVYPIAFPTGLVLGVYVVNDKPLELRSDATSVAGPLSAFKLVSTWSGSDVESFGLEDAKGGKSARVPAKGRSTIDLLAGNAPTIESLRGRIESGAAQPEAAPATSASAPVAAAQPPPAPEPTPPAGPTSIRSPADAVAAARPHGRWILGGAAVGFVLAMLLGAFRRRRPFYIDD